MPERYNYGSIRFIMFYLNMGETAKMAIEWGIDRNVIRNHWVLDVLGYPQF